VRSRDPEIDPANYLPDIPDGYPYGYAMYETRPSGTLLSPAFRSLEELARWCTSAEGTRATCLVRAREVWLASFLIRFIL
jgi:hypothetical protein